MDFSAAIAEGYDSVRSALSYTIFDLSSPVGIAAVIGFPILVALFVNAGLAFDYGGALESDARGGRRLKDSLNWIASKKIWLTGSTLQDLKLFGLGFCWIGVNRVVEYWITGGDRIAFQRDIGRFLHVPHESFMRHEPRFLLDFAFVALTLVAFEFGVWINHYLMHKVPFLWEYHKVHHSAKVLTGLTTKRIHIFEGIFWGWCGGIASALVYVAFARYFGYIPSGEDNWIVYYAQSLILLPTGILFHSPYWISFGKLEYVIGSPAMHTIHHSRDPKYHDKNFGGNLMIFDLIFGTYVKAPKTPPSERFELGVDDDFDWDNASQWQFFWSPIKRSLGRLKRSKNPNQGSTREGSSKSSRKSA